ncbi:DUF1330 domain-containing protein [Paracoccaceae bacterium]|jgi:uncharacterized protein (DUF1330 family)|nr:DUF1330 domain-containing protein [Paracoccaceae bacterium]MDA9122063.1 DUF1330 domain-containing protein [Paracoccaceae bacterium]|tara:strand:- start:779 stop:1072 length:294 start_codon:yes stop_codon:yes gene_type:complete
MSKAYVLVDTKISNNENYEIYKSKAKPIAEKFGGKYLTRGGEMDVVQSDLWSPTRLVLVEFPSIEKARAFHSSEDYADVKKIRIENAESTLVILEGL